MKVTKQDRTVRQTELVETYNLYRSLERLQNCSYTGNRIRWRRAIYHAARVVTERLRQALELP